MRVMGTKTHGYIDYIVGLLMIAAPWLFGFARDGAETWVLVAVGGFSILYSLLTRYELGALNLIPMRTHLMLDFVGGLFLVISPWVFGFADYIWEPHVAFGIFAIVASFITKQTPTTVVDKEKSTSTAAYRSTTTR